MIGARIAAYIAGAILNRARGSQLFGLTDSTAVARLISMFLLANEAMAIAAVRHADPALMAVITLWVLGTLLLWCAPAWDKYWSFAIGNGSAAQLSTPAFAPVDWIMDRLPAPSTSFGFRVWGLVAMTLRMGLGAPVALGMAYALHAPLDSAWLVLTMGLPYFISGYVSPRKYVIFVPECIVGAIWVEIFLRICS